MLRNLIIAVLAGALGMSIAAKIADGVNVHIERPAIVQAQDKPTEQVIQQVQPTEFVPTFQPLTPDTNATPCPPFQDKGCFEDMRVGIE